MIRDQYAHTREHAENQADGPEIFVIEKRRKGTPWSFLCAFDNHFEAALWFTKPRKVSAQYRCRKMQCGIDVTSQVKQIIARKSD